MPQTLETSSTTTIAEITRLTVLLYEYADDTERFSWLSTNPEELERTRAALKTLGFHTVNEDTVPTTKRLFSVLFGGDGRTVQSARTASEVLADLDTPSDADDQKVLDRITEFLANAILDEDETSEYQGYEYSITCIYTPEAGLLPRYSP
jgi:hypothetical protein